MIRQINKFNHIKISILILIVLVFVVLNPSSLSSKMAGDCEAGLYRCLVTAALSAAGNLALGAGVAAWCAVGYAWCLMYYP